MFFQCEEHGTPERISKAGCMALAKLGATVWNAWRDKFPAERYGHFDHVNIADFSSVDFNGKQWDFGGEICFDGFKFGAGADFKNAIFPRHTSFERAVFGESSDFSNAAVDARSSFKHAKFSRYTKLVSIQLDDWIDFDYAEFEGNNDFSGSSFGHSVRFNGVKFGSDINFSDCFFADGVCFETIQDPTVDAVDWIPYGSTSKTFNKISFERSVFKGFVSFKNREFRDTTIFDGVTFNQPPDFLVVHFIRICHLKPLFFRRQQVRIFTSELIATCGSPLASYKRLKRNICSFSWKWRKLPMDRKAQGAACSTSTKNSPVMAPVCRGPCLPTWHPSFCFHAFMQYCRGQHIVYLPPSAAASIWQVLNLLYCRRSRCLVLRKWLSLSGWRLLPVMALSASLQPLS